MEMPYARGAAPPEVQARRSIGGKMPGLEPKADHIVRAAVDACPTQALKLVGE